MSENSEDNRRIYLRLLLMSFVVIAALVASAPKWTKWFFRPTEVRVDIDKGGEGEISGHALKIKLVDVKFDDSRNVYWISAEVSSPQGKTVSLDGEVGSQHVYSTDGRVFQIRIAGVAEATDGKKKVAFSIRQI